MVLRTDKILWSNISENWIIKITFTFARISTLHMSKAGFYKVINISWSLDENVGGMSLKSGCLWELFCHINWSISRVSSPCIISLHITQTRQEIISFMCFQLPCKDTPMYHQWWFIITTNPPASRHGERKTMIKLQLKRLSLGMVKTAIITIHWHMPPFYSLLPDHRGHAM